MEDIVNLMSESGALPGGDGKDRSMITEVYMHGLPSDCNDLHMYKIMASFGQIAAKGLTVMTNKADGSCLGYAFINYLNPESAQLAIDTLNGTTLPDGKQLKVERKKGGKGK